MRLRRYFEEKGSLRLPVPGDIEEAPADDLGDGRIEGLMARAGVTQTELGEYLGCTPQFMSKVATGKRKWPQGDARMGVGIPEGEGGWARNRAFQSLRPVLHRSPSALVSKAWESAHVGQCSRSHWLRASTHASHTMRFRVFFSRIAHPPAAASSVCGN